MRVVFLFEGTENEPVKNPSAISRLRSMLVNDASKGQVVRLVYRMSFMMRNLQYASFVADTIVFKRCLLKISEFGPLERHRIRKCINNHMINFYQALISGGF